MNWVRTALRVVRSLAVICPPAILALLPFRFRNGTLVRDSPRTTVETAADGTCSLTVKECTMSDEGIYRCEAENKHGKAKTQATTHVQSKF